LIGSSSCCSDGAVCNGGVSDGGLHKNEEFSSAANMSGIVKWWPFKDYTNFIVKDFTVLDRPYHGKGQLSSDAE
jgi:hypothetical protein